MRNQWHWLQGMEPMPVNELRGSVGGSGAGAGGLEAEMLRSRLACVCQRWRVMSEVDVAAHMKAPRLRAVKEHVGQACCWLEILSLLGLSEAARQQL